VLGHVAMAREDLWKQLLEWRTLTGTILGPMEAWLALRSIPSLPMRLERSSVNALVVAKFLEGRPDVLRVMYPGLPSHLGHALASAQMSYFGPVISFVLKDREHAEGFLARTTLVSNATSFGGITTTAERRERWAGDAVDPGLIRMSVGCEVIEDILTDIERALES
jgi:cystathionine gamma-lyase